MRRIGDGARGAARRDAGITLADSNGTPLALKAKKGKPALSVNTKALVRHLNADRVDGSSARQLKTAGSGATSNFIGTTAGQLSTTPKAVVTTASLAKGIYYVSASASLVVPSGAGGACEVASTAPDTDAITPQAATTVSGQTTTVSITTVSEVHTPQTLKLYCWLFGSPSSNGFYGYAGLTAFRVDRSVSGTAAKGVPVV